MTSELILDAQDPADEVVGGTLTDGALKPLDARVVPCEELAGWIFTGVVAVVMLVSTGLLWSSGWNEWRSLGWLAGAQLVVLALLAWATRVAPRWTHRFTRYSVSERGIEIHRGRFWRSVINVPRSRVQHTDVSQGPIQRRYELGTLKIHTAGSTHAEIQLSGLEHKTAGAIRDFLVSWSEQDGV